MSHNAMGLHGLSHDSLTFFFLPLPMHNFQRHEVHIMFHKTLSADSEVVKDG
jgi:hypothetical protein